MDGKLPSPTRRLCMLVALGATLGGCAGDDERGPAASGSDTGTIRRVALEGGFWGLVSDGGTRYLPVNLPANFQQDGLHVSFDYTSVHKEFATTQQWGQLVELTRMEVTSV